MAGNARNRGASGTRTALCHAAPARPGDGRGLPGAVDNFSGAARSKPVGAAFELRARQFLERRGLAFVAANVTMRGGELDLVMRELSHAAQAIALERGELDIGLLHTPVPVNGRMREKLIRRDPLVAVLPKDFRRQPDGTVTLQDLAGAGLVWFPHDQLPLIRAGILSAFRQAGHPIDIVLDVNRTLTVISCVAAGCGVSLLPQSIHTFAFDGVAYGAVRDGAALPLFELSAIWPARSRPTLADRFAALLPSADVPR
ncbi:hypothetical protein G3N93_29450 [Burkholderia sp. Se-20378]|nr:hypothetical protein [Burkholderia sp. Se-20378]